MSRNLEALTSQNPPGPHKPVMGTLYLLSYAVTLLLKCRFHFYTPIVYVFLVSRVSNACYMSQGFKFSIYLPIYMVRDVNYET
jgi:hypothetical protein